MYVNTTGYTNCIQALDGYLTVSNLLEDLEAHSVKTEISNRVKDVRTCCIFAPLHARNNNCYARRCLALVCCFLWCVLTISKCPQRRGAQLFWRRELGLLFAQHQPSPSTNHVNRDEIRRAVGQKEPMWPPWNRSHHYETHTERCTLFATHH